MSTMSPRDLRLTADGDLDVSGGTAHITSGLEAMKQAVRVAVQFFLGEWFLDESEGFIDRDVMFGKNPNIPAIQVLFRKAVLSVPGVKTLDRVEFTLDSRTRTLRIDFSATCDFGVFDDSAEVTA